MADAAENDSKELKKIADLEELKKKLDTPEFLAERERIFQKFDLNGDGKISSTELGECLKKLGNVTSDEVMRMMAEIDTDGDGFISKPEFEAFAFNNIGLIKDVNKVF
ncbi:polcalcin Nic t 1-like [Euphorbia lathyris]|uniref:polcalcin Nic t 1-like n=1 Tax=Euphorbia lathyris TaxID=212925 RepID=UPI0033132C91